jgi:hypothetical protein
VNLEGACEVFVQKLQSTGWVDMGLVLTLDVIAFVEAGEMRLQNLHRGVAGQACV